MSLQLPLPNRVVLDETAYVRPLVSALEAGRPAGLAAVSRSRVRVLDWRLGQVEEIGTLELELDTENWRMMQGPAAAGTPLSQESATQEDRFFRRLARKRAELLAGLGSEVAALVERHGWERVLVAGDPRLAKPLVEALSAVGGVQTLRSDVDPGEWLPPAAIAAALLPRLEKARARQDLALVEETRAAALRGGRGAIGLQDALAALLEGRVDRLFLDDARDYAGLRGPDGELFPEGVQPAGLAPSDLEPEPRLAERMIERALETRARVTPVAGPAADALADCDGVAAALRW